MKERGMSWDALRKLIEENKTSNAIISYYYNPKIDKNNIAIFDRNLTRRKPGLLALTGETGTDEWRDSLICRAAFHGGEIPMEGNTILGSEIKEGIYRGALGVLEKLIHDGCLRRTDDIRAIFTRHERRMPTPA